LSSNDAVTAGERPARIPAKVRTIEHTWIPMPDRTRLAARIWLPVEILGNPRVRLSLTSDRPGASIMARLCDVAPGRESPLVTRDLFNLTHREGHDRAVSLVPGEPAVIELPLKVIAHASAPGIGSACPSPPRTGLDVGTLGHLEFPGTAPDMRSVLAWDWYRDPWVLDTEERRLGGLAPCAARITY
jgi:hypothetical protein